MTVKVHGVGLPTGKGSPIKVRGATLAQTTSPKFAAASKVALVFEFDSGEKGGYLLKVWEWK